MTRSRVPATAKKFRQNAINTCANTINGFFFLSYWSLFIMFLLSVMNHCRIGGQCRLTFFIFQGDFILNQAKRLRLYVVLGLIGSMWLGACNLAFDFFESPSEENGKEGGDANQPEGGKDLIPESDPFDPSALSFYVSSNGDDNNNGLSENAPFKTLAKAYEAALASSDHKRIVVLTNLIKTGLVMLDPTGKAASGSGSILIEGKDRAARLKIERSDGANDSVLEIKGGANITFEHILINGKIAPDNDSASANNRALAVAGAGTKVTLGNWAAITGKKVGNGMGNANATYGSGILIGSGAELEMIGTSEVTGCVATGRRPMAAVVVLSGGTLTMNGGSVSGNRNTNPSASGNAYGGGVYVNGGVFTMGDGAVVSRNSIVGFVATFGGGVYISSGTFTMRNGATVSDNTATGLHGSFGGGVYVGGGMFKMYDGATIGGNKLECTSTDAGYSAFGGGVCQDGGNFEMKGGVIYGTDEPDGLLKNTVVSAVAGATKGASYYKDGGTVTPYTLATTNNTVRVVQ
jgi:hypothetical protein